jgi:hypothetical protein
MPCGRPSRLWTDQEAAAAGAVVDEVEVVDEDDESDAGVEDLAVSEPFADFAADVEDFAAARLSVR